MIGTIEPQDRPDPARFLTSVSCPVSGSASTLGLDEVARMRIEGIVPCEPRMSVAPAKRHAPATQTHARALCGTRAVKTRSTTPTGLAAARATVGFTRTVSKEIAR